MFAQNDNRTPTTKNKRSPIPNIDIIIMLCFHLFRKSDLRMQSMLSMHVFFCHNIIFKWLFGDRVGKIRASAIWKRDGLDVPLWRKLISYHAPRSTLYHMHL